MKRRKKERVCWLKLLWTYLVMWWRFEKER